MICNPREEKAKQRGVDVINANIDKKFDALVAHIPEQFAEGIVKINHAVTVLCFHHKTVLTAANGGAHTGPCGCASWCELCANQTGNMVGLRSELGILDRKGDDAYVCRSCHEEVDKDFVPIKVETVARISDAVTGVIEGLHEAACAAESDAIAGRIPKEAATEAPKAKKFSAEWFLAEAAASLGPGATPEAVEATAQEAQEAHLEKKAARKVELAEKRKTRDGEKNAAKRVLELEGELQSELYKRVKYQKAFYMALDKGHVGGHWDRNDVEDEILHELDTEDIDGLPEQDLAGDLWEDLGEGVEEAQ